MFCAHHDLQQMQYVRYTVLDMLLDNIQGAAKNSPLTFFAVFSATAWNLNAKFYTHV